ncbi:hypothetical protein VTL71DRAFT_10810 [Oculimacula yallundae]|uniref:Uncharacterized protein n=1 Tax=Oculimacula yallundae TaxID=86028 RepID=A0ABR4CUB6_9HELO
MFPKAAFFTLGPLLVTRDVPKLPIAGRKGLVGSIALVSYVFVADAQCSMRNWLQPYVDTQLPPDDDPIRPLYNG